MANTVTRQVLVDGERNAVVQYYAASDGAAGDLTDSAVVSSIEIDGNPTDPSIVRISGTLVGCSGILEWDANTDVPFLALPPDEAFCFDFESFGGLRHSLISAAGANGNILLNTTGFATAGDAIHITVELKKR